MCHHVSFSLSLAPSLQGLLYLYQDATTQHPVWISYRFNSGITVAVATFDAVLGVIPHEP